MEFKTILNSLVDLFFPHRCIGCDEVLSQDDYLCLRCYQKIAFTHYPLNQNNQVYHKLRSICKVHSATAIFEFHKHKISQQILHAIKYKNQAELGALFADKIDFGSDVFHGVIPMPIHPKRLKQRGYNQIMPFAQAISTQLNIPIFDDVIVRQKHLKTQTKKLREARFQSLNNTFVLNQKLTPGHYLLVDDVLTTGSTLAHCVQLFESQPEIKISVITLAYTI